ncbi:F0F1 ATP synthase subunit A [Flexivirga caeni]|uniref:ATP synthase subunit a n=1 Tax=Flexivirga caeni TaxID=2294115 RepID=A0A3M9M5R2_9MICO|nr:F0F1 ATP synthase subunit A [Flexivirga caeni]RNI20901.1 ATP synthase F0 subunit A [Flexivirga caeni]
MSAVAYGVTQLASDDIKIGEHVQRSFLGMTFNLDTIWTTLVAALIVIILGLWARRQLTKRTEDRVPTKLQLIWEGVLKETQAQVDDNLGRVNPGVVALAAALFFFILIANWLEMIPSEPNSHLHLLPAPTADTNLTYAMAVLVMIGAWVYGIRERGVKKYFSHFLQPFPFLLPLNILEEITKPISLALRLFGNIFAGGILLSLIASMTGWFAGAFPIGGILSVIFAVLWKIFDMAIGGIQAFIFALLTVLYFGMAAGHDDDEEHTVVDGNAGTTDLATSRVAAQVAEPGSAA